MNYQEELKILESFKPIEYWKPEPGRHTLTFISEILDAESFNDEPRKKVVMNVKGSQTIWEFPKGKTKDSIYGQLVKFATSKDNRLEGHQVDIMVLGEGKQRRFTLIN